MKHEHWTARLSEYLDGELSGGRQAAVEAHLAECEACMATLADLRAVIRDAQELEPIPPLRDLWPAIEAGLAPRSAGPEATVHAISARRRSIAMTVPQLIAAGLVLMVASAGAVWLTLGGSAPAPSSASSSAVGAALADGTASALPVLHVQPHQAAISELEATFDQRRSSLDPETIMVVERNLAIIDAAIQEAARALEADPTSGFLSSYIASTMQRKVDLLRQATRLERAES